MSISIWIVTAIIVLIMFGAGQRFLDKMRLSDRWALLILASIVVGIIIPPIKIGNMLSFSIGGFLIPVGICVYMLVKAGWSMDLLRAVVGTIVTAGIILLLEVLLPSQTPQDIIVDNMYLYGIAAGVVAYLLGRSRRNAFVCSVLGLTLASVAVHVYNMVMGQTTTLALGVGGAFDSIVVATLISVGLCELVGKTMEFAVGKEDKIYSYEAGEFVEVEELEEQKNENDN